MSSKSPLAVFAVAAGLSLLVGPAAEARDSGPVPVTCPVPAAGAVAETPVASPQPPPTVADGGAGAEELLRRSPRGTADGFTPAAEPDRPGGDEIGSEPELDAPHDEVLAQDEPKPLPVSLSIGTPDAGLLLNPVAMVEGAFWRIRNPIETYGTAETVAYLQRAIESVQLQFPDSPRLVVGDISRADGGRLNRHKSHQSGRDVDLGLYYRAGEADDFKTADARTLDAERTWALVKALVTDTDVERIFLDRSLQRPLLAHARALDEDPDWLDELIGRARNGKDAILQHERRHKNHMHVRFYNPVAQDCARLNHRDLIAQGVLPPPTLRHRIRSRETLSTLARRYGVTTAAIKKANGLRGTLLRAGASLLIPTRRVAVETAPVVIPARLLPRTPPPPRTAEEPGAVAAGPSGGR